MTHATDAPGIDGNEIGAHPFGSGPVIERGSNVHPRSSSCCTTAAEAESIPYTIAASGAPHRHRPRRDPHQPRRHPDAAVIGLPLRYMHSPVEMVDLADIDQAARLAAAFARRLTAGTTFPR